MGGQEKLIGDDDHTVPSRWPTKARGRQRRRSYQYLLDLDPDLAAALDVRMRLIARSAATALTFALDCGELNLAKWLAVASPGPGLLVLDGVLAVHTRVSDRVSAELLGKGDLLQPRGEDEDEFVCSEVAWRALVTTRFAILDHGFVERVRPWPQITHALLCRAERRARNLTLHRAIAAQPRLEVRLALLLWHLAARWGKVEPGGIRLPLPLTHQLLGRLVGAERPSVSHALARLANGGLITGHGDEWHLHGTVEDHLAAVVERPSDNVEHLTPPPRHERGADAIR